jgi:hypothetical protein
VIDDDFAVLLAAAHGSAVYRAISAIRDRLTIASRESAILSRVRSAAARWHGLAPPSRIAAAASTLAVASLAHLLIRIMLPRYTVSGLPWWWNAVAAVFAIVVAIAAEPVSRAAEGSAPARLWRRIWISA